MLKMACTPSKKEGPPLKVFLAASLNVNVHERHAKSPKTNPLGNSTLSCLNRQIKCKCSSFERL